MRKRSPRSGRQPARESTGVGEVRSLPQSLPEAVLVLAGPCQSTSSRSPAHGDAVAACYAAAGCASTDDLKRVLQPPHLTCSVEALIGIRGT